MYTYKLTGPKPKGIKVETFRIDYLIRTPKVEKFSLQPISKALCLKGLGFRVLVSTDFSGFPEPKSPVPLGFRF